MANKNGNPETLKPWKPGESGNASGRPKSDNELSKIRNLTNEQIHEVATLLLDTNFEGLALILKDPNTPALKLWISKIIINGIKKGEVSGLSAILDRILGKPKQTIDANVKGSIHTELVDIIKDIEKDKDLDFGKTWT